jgi:hypothetical protein
MLAGGITPEKLSTGGPSWDASGNLTSGGAVNAGGAVSNQGSLSIYNATAGVPATTGSTDSAVAARIRTQNIALDVGTYSGGQTWIQNRLFNNNATNADIAIQPNGGNVGIGTSSPSAKLQIRPTTNVNLAGSNSGAAFKWTAQNDASSAYVDLITNAATQQFQTGGIERLRIDASGINVTGIAKLAAASTVGTQIQLDNSGSAGGKAWNIISAGSGNGSGAGALEIGTPGGGGNINTQGNPIKNCPTTAKAWVNFNGTSTIRSSYNVSSITKNATGEYTVNFETPMANANYSVGASYGGMPNPVGTLSVPSYTTTSVRVVSAYFNGTTGGNPQDAPYVNVQVFGD